MTPYQTPANVRLANFGGAPVHGAMTILLNGALSGMSHWQIHDQQTHDAISRCSGYVRSYWSYSNDGFRWRVHEFSVHGGRVAVGFPKANPLPGGKGCQLDRSACAFTDGMAGVADAEAITSRIVRALRPLAPSK